MRPPPNHSRPRGSDTTSSNSSRSGRCPPVPPAGAPGVAALLTTVVREGNLHRTGGCRPTRGSDLPGVAAGAPGRLAITASGPLGGPLRSLVHALLGVTLASDTEHVQLSTGEWSVLTPESLARFAGVLADRSRAAMCLALLDGRAWTAGELARYVGVARSTASEHLNVLVSAGLLAEERQGRHRYLRLADAGAAQLVEDLAAAVGKPSQPSSMRTVRSAGHLAAGRTCYDHLAGTLGVALFEALVARGLVGISDGLVLTAAGRSWFTDLAGAEALNPVGSRPLLRTCLDWTERRPHLGGALAAVLCHQLLDRAWITRGTPPRAVAVTAAGSRALTDLLGLDDVGLRLGW